MTGAQTTAIGIDDDDDDAIRLRGDNNITRHSTPSAHADVCLI